MWEIVLGDYKQYKHCNFLMMFLVGHTFPRNLNLSSKVQDHPGSSSWRCPNPATKLFTRLRDGQLVLRLCKVTV